MSGVMAASSPFLSLSVVPAIASVSAGDLRAFTVTGLFGDGSSRDLTSVVRWSSSDRDVATIDTAGVATAVAAGSVTITAKFAGVAAHAHLIVEDEDP